MICDDECCAIGRDGNCNLILDEPTVSIAICYNSCAQ
jgi:hypothetical protein